MNRPDLILVIYSLLLFLGGLIGYFRAGSTVSLVMSTFFSLLLFGTLYLQKTYPEISLRLMYGLLGFLTLFFTFRAFNTGKLMPSGIVALLSLLTLVLEVFFREKIK